LPAANVGAFAVIVVARRVRQHDDRMPDGEVIFNVVGAVHPPNRPPEPSFPQTQLYHIPGLPVIARGRIASAARLQCGRMFARPHNPLIFALAALVFTPGCDAIRRAPGAGDTEIVVEVAVFKGGYGIEWHTRIAEQFNRDHADENVRIELWGDPRTADIIKPRLLRRDPPDLILDERLPIWLLIGADKLVPFNDALAKPAPGGDGPWGERFAPGMLNMFRSGEEVYAIPAAYGAWTGWYNARLFREHGWEPPATWEAFDALCREIRETGIAPIALQGKYASFYAWHTYVAVIQRVGGVEAINRINALEPGAFSHPDAVRAAQLFQDLIVTHGQRGAMAMTHTESQLQFVNNQAAMIFCGIWLENEMKDSMPSGFEMRCFNIPPVEGGKGNPAMLPGQGMEYLFVPVDGRHHEYAFEFASYLVSPKYAADMGESIGVISPLEDATPREAVSPALGSVLDVIDASVGIFNIRVRDLLPEWRSQVMHVAISSLCRGEITPEEFARQLDEGVAAAVANPDVMKPPFVPLDPVASGEGS
jgi:N-acetylglucosamine transport system substrate-binding protein